MRRWWLMQRGWISGAWGASDNNPQSQVLFHHAGRAKGLASEAENWERIVE
jgi:hypothetical protein